jgi:hypothetical protein
MDPMTKCVQYASGTDSGPIRTRAYQTHIQIPLPQLSIEPRGARRAWRPKRPRSFIHALLPTSRSSSSTPFLHDDIDIHSTHDHACAIRHGASPCTSKCHLTPREDPSYSSLWLKRARASRMCLPTSHIVSWELGGKKTREESQNGVRNSSYSTVGLDQTMITQKKTFRSTCCSS